MGLYLVDGSFEIFRCFHAMPRSHGDEAQEVGAARGLFAQCVVGSSAVLLNRIRPPSWQIPVSWSEPSAIASAPSKRTQ